MRSISFLFLLAAFFPLSKGDGWLLSILDLKEKSADDGLCVLVLTVRFDASPWLVLDV